MTEDICCLKRRFTKNYIGHYGIHGFGCSRGRNIIFVYYSATEDSIKQNRLLNILEKKARPYTFEKVKEQQAVITKDKN